MRKKRSNDEIPELKKKIRGAQTNKPTHLLYSRFTIAHTHLDAGRSKEVLGGGLGWGGGGAGSHEGVGGTRAGGQELESKRQVRCGEGRQGCQIGSLFRDDEEEIKKNIRMEYEDQGRT